MARYGFVKVVGGRYKGRIGYYDDDDEKAIVYWGSESFSSNAYSLIDYQFLDNNITTLDLVTRIQEIMNEIMKLKYVAYDAKKHSELLSEYILADSLLTENIIRPGRKRELVNRFFFLIHQKTNHL